MHSHCSSFSLFFASLLLLTSCASNSSVTPEGLAEAIKKNPTLFMQTLREAAQNEQRTAYEKASADREAQIEKDLKNPRSVKIDESRIIYGEAIAPITIVKYADFQCPACRAGYVSLEEVKKKYPGKIRFIHKNIPLRMHPQAQPAAEIYEYLVMTDKTKALQFYKKAYESQSEWHSDAELWKMAAKIGIDKKKVQAAVKKGEIQKRIDEDLKEHADFGFEGTPAYMVNGVSMYGAPSAAEFAKFIDKVAKK